ncbi:unnamed protein product [Linum trigynum]|uniref:Uncharacterized protein n=1 Tax=Linum trigynum TaxID=586398 RepID=A0AAV2D4N2_9ROSI
MSVLKLNSYNQFIRTLKGDLHNIFVYDYMDDPNVFEMIHASIYASEPLSITTHVITTVRIQKPPIII